MAAIGQIGSIAHVLTNKNIKGAKAKGDTLADINLATTKSNLAILGSAAAIGGATAAATKFIPKAEKYAIKGLNKAKDALGAVKEAAGKVESAAEAVWNGSRDPEGRGKARPLLEEDPRDGEARRPRRRQGFRFDEDEGAS